MIWSGVAHAALLIYAAIGFSSASAFDPHKEALPVEVVTLSEFDQLTEGNQFAKEKEVNKVQAKKVAAVDAKPVAPAPEAKEDVLAPPPAPEPEAAEPPPPKPEEKQPAEATPPPPEPTPSPEPKKAEAEPKPAPPMPAPKPPDLPKPEKKAEKPPEKKVEKKAEKPKPKFDPTKIASLIDKRDPGLKAQEGREVSNTTSAGTAMGTASQLSLSQESMLVRMIQEQIYPCWTPPIGAAQATDLVAVIQFNLTEQGTLVGTPTLENSSGNPLFTSFAESAMRAVHACTQATRPLRLPPEHYGKWRMITLDFVIPPV
jgi:colicin import membrane protein